MSSLSELGWDDAWAAVFAKRERAGLVPARVSIEYNHIYRVVTAEGERRTASPSAR